MVEIYSIFVTVSGGDYVHTIYNSTCLIQISTSKFIFSSQNPEKPNELDCCVCAPVNL